MRGEKEAGELSVYTSPYSSVALGREGEVKSPCLHISKHDNRLIQVAKGAGQAATRLARITETSPMPKPIIIHRAR